MAVARHDNGKEKAMPNKNRSFKEELKEFIGKPLSLRLARDSAKVIQNTIATEDPTISQITCYFVYGEMNAHRVIKSPVLYFVITSDLSPSDTHMSFPVVNNPECLARFLRENEQRAQEDLTQYESVVFIIGDSR